VFDVRIHNNSKPAELCNIPEPELVADMVRVKLTENRLIDVLETHNSEFARLKPDTLVTKTDPPNQSVL